MSKVAGDETYWVEDTIQNFDFQRVCGWLGNEAYWSEGIPNDTVIKAFENSVSFGLFHDQSGQVGIARMITDLATFSYLADVFIDENHRGQGLGRMLMEAINSHPELQGLRRQMLATRDMHKLYEQYGYTSVGSSDLLMEKVDQDIYKTKVVASA